MRWLAWTVLMAIAMGAGAIGIEREFNPVRTHPQSSPQEAIHRVIVKLRAGGGAATAQVAGERVAAILARRGMHLRATRAITAALHAVRVDPAVAGESVTATLERLRADPEVEYAAADERRYPHRIPGDSLYLSQQWYLQPSSAMTPSAIDAQTAWDTTTGSTGLVIADLDTGVRYEHPDLLWAWSAGPAGRLLPGYNFISDPLVANEGGATRGPDATDPGDYVTQANAGQPECSGLPAGSTFPIPSSWHGTRTAGLLGALTDNNFGMAGMTWSAWLLPVRVLGTCGGQDSDILAAMLWAGGISVNGAPDNPYPARIENMSLGGSGSCPPTYVDAVNQLRAKGVLIVASAGNEGGPVDAPANCPGVAGIAGIRHAGTKVGFSSLGPEIALSAPAGNCVNITVGSTCLYPITSAVNDGVTSPDPAGNGFTDQVNDPNLGTSFSAPLVSGIAALMLSVNGNLGSLQLIARLQEGSLPFPQTSVGESTQPLMCRVPTGPGDLQTSECICTLDGQTCGAGMASASGALRAALRPIAAVQVPANFAPGANVAFDATGSSAACTHSVASYQWVSSDPNNPVMNPTGPMSSVTAPSTGSLTVTLTVTDDAGKSDVATVTVDPTSATSSAPSSAGTTACLTAINVPSPVTVAVSSTSGSVQAGGGTDSFSAVVGGSLNQQVSWEVNGVAGGNTMVGTISSAGLYTAPASVPSPATVTVTAVAAADPTRSSAAMVTITAAAGGGGGGGGHGGGGGALDALSLLVLALALARVSPAWLARYRSRSAASSHSR